MIKAMLLRQALFMSGFLVHTKMQLLKLCKLQNILSYPKKEA